MAAMDWIATVLRRPEFTDRPPVLIDVGAAGALNGAWAPLAPYAVAVAFDPDRREMGHVDDEQKGYKKLHVYGAALTDHGREETEVFLTRSPQCSSTLRPNAQSLKQWEFARLFDVVGSASVKAVNIQSVLRELDLTYVDWFKCDSQGTDLRLFKSLGDQLMSRVLVAEFEPGILDAYAGEDTLGQVLDYMTKPTFWMSDFAVKGTQRISAELADQVLSEFERKNLSIHQRISPGWAEMRYLNSFADADSFSMRDYLLGWVIATVDRQFGFAIELCTKAKARFDDPMFTQLADESLRSVRVTQAQYKKWRLKNKARHLAGKMLHAVNWFGQ